MNRYKTEVEVTTRHTIRIDAENEEDVMEQVDKLDDCDIVNQAVDSVSVEVEIGDIELMEDEDE